MLLSLISITKPAERLNIIREERFPFSTPGSTTAGPNHSQNLTLIVACVAYAKEAHTGSEGRCTICCRHASRSVLPLKLRRLKSSLQSMTVFSFFRRDWVGVQCTFVLHRKECIGWMPGH